MDEAILIKLLQLQYAHQRRLSEFVGKLNLSYFELDLLGLVLDAVGIPADNTLEQIGKYGYGNWIKQPDTFSRARYYDKFQQVVTQGSYEECKAYLEEIIITGTFQQLLIKNGKIDLIFIEGAN